MRYNVRDIAYETDGEAIELPAEMTLDIEDDANPALELAGAISDRTGFCVNTYSFSVVPEM